MDTASTTSGPQFVGEIGVRGELYVAVDKQEYTAGDTVTGRLTVTVSETIQCDTLTLTITGEESAQWTERGDHHSRYEEFLHHTILTTALPMPCPPGEYLFPFTYALPTDAPGVLDADSLDGDVQALHATIKYALKASVKVEGRFVSDLEAAHALVVREAPTLPHSHSRRTERTAGSVERTVSKRVRLLGCLPRGTCHVAAAIRTNVLALGETVRVDVFVNNHTSALAVQSVRCRVYQDVTLGDLRTASRPLLQVQCDGPQSGELLERPLDVVLAGKLRYPTTRGHFLRCSYRISVECAMLFASPIVVDLPVTILPARGPLRPLHVGSVTAPFAAQQPTPLAAGATARRSSTRLPPPPVPTAATATSVTSSTSSRPSSTATAAAATSTASNTSSRPSSTVSTLGTTTTTTTVAAAPPASTTPAAPPASAGQPFAHLIAAPPHPTIDLMA